MGSLHRSNKGDSRARELESGTNHFEIPMDDVLAVKMFNGNQYLFHNLPGIFFAVRATFYQLITLVHVIRYLFEKFSSFNKRKNQENVFRVSEDIDEIHHIWVFDLLLETKSLLVS